MPMTRHSKHLRQRYLGDKASSRLKGGATPRPAFCFQTHVNYSDSHDVLSRPLQLYFA